MFHTSAFLSGSLLMREYAMAVASALAPMLGVYVFVVFPLRSRIIAALSRAVVVVEAAVTGERGYERDGARHQRVRRPRYVDRETTVG